jgi:uncharacterized membrane protein
VNEDIPEVCKLAAGAPWRALRYGLRSFREARIASICFSMVFALLALVMFAGAEHAGVAPMLLPLAGGFMLVAPALLCGFLALAEGLRSNTVPAALDAFRGFRRYTREMFALSLVCLLLFMIWVTDAATLYGFMIGRQPMGWQDLLSPADAVLKFTGWSALMGGVLAFVIFSVTVFSVPLLYYRRARLVRAVVLSVRGVFANFVVCLGWGIVLATMTIGSILLLPLFVMVFPVLAFASHALYQEVFPAPENEPRRTTRRGERHADRN